MLGSLLINPVVLSRVEGLVEADDFHSGPHQTLYRAMQGEIAKSGTVDLLTLKASLGGAVAEVGGLAYISSLIDGIPDIGNVERYARIVKEKAAARSLAIRLTRAADALLDGKPVAEIAPHLANELLESPTSGGRESLASASAKDLVRAGLSRFEYRLEHPGAAIGIPTGFESLDLYLYGYQRGTVLVEASRPSVGKTTVGWNQAIAALNASEATRIAYFSLEMTRAMLEDRLLSMVSGVPSAWIKTGTCMNAEAVNRVVKAGSQIAGWGDRLYANANPLNIRQMLAEARRLHKKGGLDIIFVDYLQLVTADKSSRSREEEVSGTSKALMRLAKDLDIAVVAFAQLNRAATGKEDRPTADNLRESDAIFHDARSLIILDRPRLRDRENPSRRYCQLNFHLDKNSEGPLGTIPFHFEDDKFRVVEGQCREGCRYYQSET